MFRTEDVLSMVVMITSLGPVAWILFPGSGLFASASRAGA
jgi:hypothetical protein